MASGLLLALDRGGGFNHGVFIRKDDEGMSAISGTRRKAGEMTDGTLRVVIDIDDQHKAAFHELFPIIDMPVAIAPLVGDFERLPAPEKFRIGPLCSLAVRWCQDKDFQQWAEAETEEQARDHILNICGVESRKEIDQDAEAAALFNEEIRVPYMNSRKERDI
jgi:hypothetical protein